MLTNLAIDSWRMIFFRWLRRLLAVGVVVVVVELLAGVLPNLEIHTSSIKGRNNHRIDPCWARERQARDISDDILAIQNVRDLEKLG